MTHRIPKVRLATPADAVASKPRIGVFTPRGSNRQVSRCPGYEFEDMIVGELGPAAFVEPRADALHGQRLRASRWLSRHVPRLGGASLGARGVRLEEDLDLFFAAPAVSRDLLLMSTVLDWRRRSARAVCFLQELWVPEMAAQLRGVIGVLNQFDHVFCGLYHSAEALRGVLSVPVDYLPLGVDTELFYPFRSPEKARIIDACAIGNMDATTHRALCDWSENTGRYYHFSTVANSNFSPSHSAHRQNLAQTLQRSNVFFTYMAKRAVTGQRSSQEEFGPRYFEGAAAGALQVGDVVRSNPAYRENVDWEGAVIEARYSSAEMPALIEEIGRDSAWVAAQRRANVTNCLLRHDHLYRWDRVMAVAGLPETPGMAARRSRLAALAAGLSMPPSRAVAGSTRG